MLKKNKTSTGSFTSWDRRQFESDKLPNDPLQGKLHIKEGFFFCFYLYYCFM